MPFIVSVTSAASSFTTTGQNIIDCVKQDTEYTALNSAVILDYTSRIQLQMLRASNWTFLAAPIQRFITQEERNDYWIGATGFAPAGAVDTGLNLTDLGRIREGEVFDRSNFRPLLRTSQAPLLARLGFQDATSRIGRPAVWRNSPDAPYVLSLYPSPDNENTYQPVPEAPLLISAAGGALPGRTYYVKLSFLDNMGGESQPSDNDGLIRVPANNLLTVRSPLLGISHSASGVQYTSYKIYASTVLGSETLQATVGIGADWAEPPTGLTTGGAVPITNPTIEPLRGYIIEFSYFKGKQPVTSASQVLQIPDDYKDIVCAGCAWLTARFQKREPEAQMFFAQYKDGIIQMIRDKNLFPKDDSFIGPDSAAIGRQLPSIESLDLTRFLLP